MKATISPATQAWLLSGDQAADSALDRFLARPVASPKQYGPRAGAHVLAVLARGLQEGAPPLLVLTDAAPTLDPAAAKLSTDLAAELRQGLSLARALSSHPDAFGPNAGAVLQAHSLAAPLAEAVSAVARAAQPHTQTTATLTSRQGAWAVLAAAALFAGVIAAALTPALDSTWATAAGYATQTVAAATTLTAALLLAGSRTHGAARALSQRVLDPHGSLALAAAAASGYTTLAALCAYGVPAHTALGATADSSSDPRTADAFRRAAEATWAGAALADALASQPFLPTAPALAGAATPQARSAALLLAATPPDPGPTWVHLRAPATLTALTWVGTLATAWAVA